MLFITFLSRFWFTFFVSRCLFERLRFFLWLVFLRLGLKLLTGRFFFNQRKPNRTNNWVGIGHHNFYPVAHLVSFTCLPAHIGMQRFIKNEIVTNKVLLGNKPLGANSVKLFEA